MSNSNLKLNLPEIKESINRCQYLLQLEKETLEYESGQYNDAVDNKKYSENRLIKWRERLSRRLELHECLKNIMDRPSEVINAEVLSLYIEASAEDKNIDSFAEMKFLITVENMQIQSVLLL